MMAYPPVLRDVNDDVIPQVFDGTNWRPLKGSQSGNQQAQLLGPDGQPISSTNRLPVADEAAVNKLQAVQSLLETLGSIVATEQGQSAVKQAIEDLASSVATASGQAAIAQALAALEQVAAKENTLGQVLAKLSDDPATQTTLVAVLQALQGTLSVQLSAAADVSDRSNRELGKVTVSGTADITDRENRKLGEVTVAGAADISDRPGRKLGQVTFPEAQEVTLSGQIVEIDSVTYEIDPPRTIYGLAAQRPSASAAHAVIPWAYYVAADTGAVSQTDGTDWMDVL